MTFAEEAKVSGYNVLIDGNDKSMGIIACGLAYNYLMENYPDGCPYPVLKIGHYPLPHDLVNQLKEKTDSLLIIEEGYPIVEEMIRGFLGHEKLQIKGRLDGTLPRAGELNPNHVAKALGINIEDTYSKSDTAVPRPPSMCPGCVIFIFTKH